MKEDRVTMIGYNEGHMVELFFGDNEWIYIWEVRRFRFPSKKDWDDGVMEVTMETTEGAVKVMMFPKNNVRKYNEIRIQPSGRGIIATMKIDVTSDVMDIYADRKNWVKTTLEHRRLMKRDGTLNFGGGNNE